MADEPDVLTEPGRRAPLLVVVVVVLLVALVSWLVSRSQTPTPPAAASQAPETPLIFPVGPSYASTGPTLGPPESPCPKAAASPSASPVAAGENRVKAGHLSFATEATFRPAVRSNYLPFATDVTLQYQFVFSNDQLDTPAWTAVLAVGKLPSRNGFAMGRSAAALERVVGCLVSGYAGQGRNPVARVVSRQTEIFPSDVTGDRLTADIVMSSETGFPGERVTVVVVPDGGEWDLFLASVPIGSAETTATAAKALESLRFER